MTDPMLDATPIGSQAQPVAGQSPRTPPPGDLRTNLYLGILVVYVVLLGIGVVAEAFHIQWILDWPIF